MLLPATVIVLVKNTVDRIQLMTNFDERLHHIHVNCAVIEDSTP